MVRIYVSIRAACFRPDGLKNLKQADLRDKFRGSESGFKLPRQYGSQSGPPTILQAQVPHDHNCCLLLSGQCKLHWTKSAGLLGRVL